MKICDLHTHSMFSDGTFTPTELVIEAKKKGISAIALTDHNTIKGLSEFMRAGEEYNIITVPGIEFSTKFKGVECHIVGLNILPEYYTEIEEMMRHQHELNHKSNHDLIDKLSENGFKINYDDVIAFSGNHDFNRAHIGHYLVKTNQIESISKAFETVLSEINGYYVPSEKTDTLLILKFLNKIGAVSVWAHPYESVTDRSLIEEFAKQFKQYGLKAIETRYVLYDEKTMKQSEILAEKYSLLQSGGSDFHGERKPTIALGTGYGNLIVPYDFYENLCTI